MNSSRERVFVSILLVSISIWRCSDEALPQIPPPSEAEEWGDVIEVTVVISSPADGTYLSINGSIGLQASALDCDKYRVGSNWYTYSDEVNSGESASDYHMYWAASGVGSLGSVYGTEASYYAPSVLGSSEVSEVTIYAIAQDLNYEGDNYGYSDGTGGDSIALNVWQVSLSKDGGGQESALFNGTSFSAAVGGMQLGELNNGDTVNYKIVGESPGSGTCYSFADGVQIDGDVPSDTVIPTGPYSWYQQINGVQFGIFENQTEYYEVDTEGEYEPDGSATSANSDGDSRNTEAEGSPDVNKVFYRDAPGYYTGTDNKAGSYVFVVSDVLLKDEIRLYGTRVSNIFVWGQEMYLYRESVEDEWGRF